MSAPSLPWTLFAQTIPHNGQPSQHDPPILYTLCTLDKSFSQPVHVTGDGAQHKRNILRPAHPTNRQSQ